MKGDAKCEKQFLKSKLDLGSPFQTEKRSKPSLRDTFWHQKFVKIAFRDTFWHQKLVKIMARGTFWHQKLVKIMPRSPLGCSSSPKAGLGASQPPLSEPRSSLPDLRKHSFSLRKQQLFHFARHTDSERRREHKFGPIGTPCAPQPPALSTLNLPFRTILFTI